MTTLRVRSRSTLLVAAALLLAGVVAGASALAMAPGPAGDAAPVTAGSEVEDPAPVPATPPTRTTSAAAAVAAMSLADQTAPPRHLQVPALGIDAPVGDLGLTDGGRLEVPTTADDVGWWSGGSEPGSPGPTVLAGHVDWQGRAGVFQRLGDLVAGDLVTVRDADGNEHNFRVDRIEQHPKDAFPTDAVYGPTDDPTLRLITCGGAFDATTGHYLDNVIVFATATD